MFLISSAIFGAIMGAVLYALKKDEGESGFSVSMIVKLFNLLEDANYQFVECYSASYFLVDTQDKKILIVSSVSTPSKVQLLLSKIDKGLSNKNKDIKLSPDDLLGYYCKFFFLKGSTPSLRKKEYEIPVWLEFVPENDILDIELLEKKIACISNSKQEKIREYIESCPDFAEFREKKSSFKLLSAIVRMPNSKEFVVQFSDNNSIENNFFSLLIGKNGTGKSTLLSAIIHFFLDVAGFSKRSSASAKKWLSVVGVCYFINSSRYDIEIDGRNYSCKKNGNLIPKEDLELPYIIATSMGAFDKFPIINRTSYKELEKREKINSIYKYLGSRANTNLVTSQTKTFIGAVLGFGNITTIQQIELIRNAFGRLGFDARFTIEYKFPIDYEKNARQRDNNYYEKLQNNYPSVLKDLYSEEKNEGTIDIDFEKITVSELKKKKLSLFEGLFNIYYTPFKACYLYRNNERYDCNLLSSGEFSLLTMQLKIVSAAQEKNLLVLIDEPEISQHPNWQIDFIPLLNNSLAVCNCHFLIATHSHFLVSNLPLGQAKVIGFNRNEEGDINVSNLPSNTYGWSSEEVLLKIFNMATDRSRYLAEMVAELIGKISDNEINYHEAREKVQFLKTVSLSLSNVDPLKPVINSIVCQFEKADNHG